MAGLGLFGLMSVECSGCGYRFIECVVSGGVMLWWFVRMCWKSLVRDGNFVLQWTHELLCMIRG